MEGSDGNPVFLGLQGTYSYGRIIHGQRIQGQTGRQGYITGQNVEKGFVEAGREHEVGVKHIAVVCQVVNFVCGRGDNAIVESSATKTPEKVFVLRGRDSDEIASRGDELDRLQSIKDETVKALVSTNTTSKGSAHHSHARAGANFCSKGVREDGKETE